MSNDKEENGNTCIHGTGWKDDPSKCVFKLMILEATQKSMYMYMILEIWNKKTENDLKARHFNKDKNLEFDDV